MKSNRKIPSRDTIARIILDNLDYLVSFAAFRTGNRQDAEDVVQTAVLRLLQQQPPVREAGVRMWLFRTVYNLCNDACRRTKPEITDLEQAEAIVEEDDTTAIEEIRRINAILSTLPKNQAEAIRLHITDELTFEEAAEISGVPISTIKSRFQTGIKKLQELYFK